MTGATKSFRVKVTSANGEFFGEAKKRKKLPGGKTYWCRARQKAEDKAWSDWSHWHQAFKTEE